MSKVYKDFEEFLVGEIGFVPNKDDAWYRLHRKVWIARQAEIDELKFELDAFLSDMSRISFENEMTLKPKIENLEKENKLLIEAVIKLTGCDNDHLSCCECIAEKECSRGDLTKVRNIIAENVLKQVWSE